MAAKSASQRVGEGETRLPSRLGSVGPAVVVAVVADRRGGNGLELEELVEEGREAALEVGHGRSLGDDPPASRRRRRPGQGHGRAGVHGIRQPPSD